MARFIFVLFALCLLCVYVDAQRMIDCGPDAVPAPCGRSCEPTCKDTREKLCKVNPDTCPTQCRCGQGLVRNEETDQCIAPEQCPKKACKAH